MSQNNINSVLENYSLLSNNSFGLNIKTKYFFAFDDIDLLSNLLHDKKYSHLHILTIGSGSNILFTKNFDGIVIKPMMLGFEILKETESYVHVKANSGEIWDDFVLHAVLNNWGGIENLSGIPGTLGACPIQNIGAYGAEVKDTIVEMEIFDIISHKKSILSNADCMFEYRNSVFKRELKGQYVILNVTFKLSKKHVFNTCYNDIENEIKQIGDTNLTNIRQAILNIRNRKLPDPLKTGNAGSFFKNPVISNDIAQKIKKEFPEVPLFNAHENSFKISAAWLIEQCGWKGKQIGNVGVHSKHALILVNYGNGTGAEIIELAEEIINSVKNKFNIVLSTEVNII